MGLFIWGIAAVLMVGCALFQPTPLAETTYTSELLSCNVAAKAHHPLNTPEDKAAGRVESNLCECQVDKKWGLPSAC